MSELFSLLDVTLLNSTLRFVAPILLAALGGMLCQRAGIFNIALEGLMLVGAFGAVVGSHLTGNALGGVATAMLAGALMALVMAVFVVSLKGDAIVVSIAINLLAVGLTAYLLTALFGVKGAFRPTDLQGLNAISVPGLAHLPLLGPLLSGHSILVYLSWVFVFASYFLLYRHVWGLRIRGVGEHSAAAETLGVNVAAIQYGVLILSGVLCGLAGAQLSLGNVTLFVENMSAGRGWIAVVAVMLGQANPLGVAATSLLFGFTDSLGFRLQGLNLPSQLTEAVPYLATLAGLFLVAMRRRRALGT
jgi:ABC-type uncharacterized transport system permease subunit